MNSSDRHNLNHNRSRLASLPLPPKGSQEAHHPLTLPSLENPPILPDFNLYSTPNQQNYNYSSNAAANAHSRIPVSPTYQVFQERGTESANSGRIHSFGDIQRSNGSLGYHKDHQEPMFPHDRRSTVSQEDTVLCYDMETKTYKMVERAVAQESRYKLQPVDQSPTDSTYSKESPRSSSDSPEKAKRSRKGCLTCRQRKKKCCETRPTCSECSRLMIRCRWPVPGSERKNRSKNNTFNPDEMLHEAFGVIKILRGVVDYKVEG
ncbi:hypothetical protein OGAPHI_002150 [Ogataea philodendri]|uniref:Zn(2)-C6 fungal-type domain-containing protein n=1 Tax=Ogataea philodendri TaxID=1378263 RepID=A0A9P8PAX5_9ASCO|nr:uncharacterized protein OGAPHI_002150 [Ogataea philodendri]KAH3668396.1 hypothetical protein OGAPHI_002150 [Ogataea philodendri]